MFQRKLVKRFNILDVVLGDDHLDGGAEIFNGELIDEGEGSGEGTGSAGECVDGFAGAIQAYLYFDAVWVCMDQCQKVGVMLDAVGDEAEL